MGSGEYRSSTQVRTGLVQGNTFEQREVRYAVIGGEAIFEGDIVLGSVEEVEQRSAPAGGPGLEGLVITGEQFRWPAGIVPFTIDPALPSPSRVNDAIAHWHSRTRIRLVPRTSEANFVTFRPGDGCSSRVGMRGGQQFITLAAGCGNGNTIHEIGHAVGLWHEQSREDRDQFVRIHFENIEEDADSNFNQHITDGDDVGSYDFGSIMHYSRTAFSKNGQPTIETLNGEAIGQRTALSDGDVAAVDFMYFPTVPLPLMLQTGVYTIRQKSSGRFVDAHENSGKDFTLVTRTAQNNRTQEWVLKAIGGVYEIRQKSSGRFVDAHEHAGRDFALVTRGPQNNDTQRWVVVRSSGDTFTIQQKSSGRFVDAHDQSDFTLVTRGAQGDNTQRWTVVPATGDTFTIRQKSSGRFVDAHEIEAKDFGLVTRTAQNNATQEWTLAPVGVVCTLQQRSNGRYVDAHDHSGDDFKLVTRTAQSDDSQKWIVLPSAAGTFTMQQKSTGRFADAHEIAGKDFALVTRDAQDNDTQRWLISPA